MLSVEFCIVNKSCVSNSPLEKRFIFSKNSIKRVNLPNPLLQEGIAALQKIELFGLKKDTKIIFLAPLMES